MFTSRVFNLALLSVLIGIGILLAFPNKRSDNANALGAAIAAVKLQDDLISLEQTRTEAITNNRSSFLLSAETTTILTTRIMWRTPLREIQTQIKGNVVYVRLPPTVPMDPIVDAESVKTYSNGSLLFTDETVQEQMVKESIAKAKKNAIEDKSALPLARQNAIDIVQMMFSSVKKDDYIIKVE
jgi:hypothetical protein